MSSEPFNPLDFRNTNALWCSVLVETLARLGLTHAVISPGSRSTPLTMALVRHPRVKCIPILDERSAAFFALGLARRTGKPAVLVCTSGTAGANYFPAVIEADESGVPMLVITADRPPEMRACRSGQTIDQQKLFGGHVRFHHELAVPAAEPLLLAYLRQTIAHAWERTQGSDAGPVHLNAPFRDPLAPIEDGSASPLRGTLKAQRFFAGVAGAPKASVLQVDAVALSRALQPGRPKRGLIVAGGIQLGDPAAYVREIGRLSRKLGWPVLADALSPLRNFADLLPNLVTTYDVIARSAAAESRLKPEQVLCLHDWPTSKALRQWLQKADPEIVFVSSPAQNPDALHGRAIRLRGELGRMDSFRAVRAKATWLASWLQADRRIRRSLGTELGASATNFEGRVSALLPESLPAGTAVFAANSMPVRDLEYFWPPNRRRHQVFFNRGANGIDGTLSTALGVAHESGRPAVLLTGDLALLHDANGFLSAKRLRGSLTVVLINNNGGGIFEHLPVARFDSAFEEFFATPQDAGFSALCVAHGIPHAIAQDAKHLGRMLAKLPGRGVRVIELRTDRKGDAHFRQQLFSRLAAQLS